MTHDIYNNTNDCRELNTPNVCKPGAWYAAAVLVCRS